MENKYIDIPFNVKSDDITPEGIFKGSASDFIDSPDSYGDVIVKGAFKETLEKGGRNGTGVAMLWQHDSKQPIGVWQSLLETNKSLDVIGQLALEVQKGKEAFVLMRMKALNGLSIGWDILRDKNGDPFEDSYEVVETENQRLKYLKRLELWEISPVTFPANKRSTITQVKSAVEEASTIRELEKALRDAGLSINASKYIAGLCKPELLQRKNKTLYSIIDALHDLNRNLK